MKRLNIGLFAHVDAGKTTVAEQLIFSSGAKREVGNVNKGSSTLDFHDIERKRGITIYAEQAEISWQDTKINIIDTPGHVDFASDMERSLSVLDCALLVISAADGVQSHTETIFKLLEQNGIPTLFVVNKMDREAIDLKGLKESIKSLANEAIFIQEPNGEGKNYKGNISLIKEDGIEETVKEFIIEQDEYLTNQYLMEEDISCDEIMVAYKKAIANQQLIPVLFGSAMKGLGMTEILDSLVQHYPCFQDEDDEPFAGRAYAIKVDSDRGLLTYIKVLSGELKLRDEIQVEGESMKITAISKAFGNKLQSVKCLKAGELGAVTGLKDIAIGQGLGYSNKSVMHHMIKPVLGTRVLCSEEDERAVVSGFSILNMEDPQLQFKYEPSRQVIEIAVMGSIQVQVLKEVMRERFNLAVDFGDPYVHYKESICEESSGFCHFEPKKHFAEVEVQIQPRQLGEGICFKSEYSVDYLPKAYQSIIEKNIPDALKHGVLLGAPVTDIDVILTAGKHHLEHTHGGDFRIATIRAVQQALQQNTSKLLEPYYAFKVTVQEDEAGKIIADLLQLKAELNEPEQKNGRMIIQGIMPVATSMNYPIQLASSTGGKGMIQLRLHGYLPCHNEEAVLDNADNHIQRDERLYNAITILREKKKMKKILQP